MPVVPHAWTRRRVLAAAAAAGAVVGTTAGPAAANATDRPNQATDQPNRATGGTKASDQAKATGRAEATGRANHAAGRTVGVAAGAALVPADPLLHLLRRATYGPTPQSVAEIRSLGANAWLDRQLNPADIDDSACDEVLTRFDYLTMGIPDIRAAAAAGKLKRGGYDAMRQLGQAAIARAAWSRRQLFEVMVDFWNNHLTVTCPFGGAWDSRNDYDRTVIRAHALGRYADLLRAGARHPAMLAYLDNRVSTRTRPNENYGRELLELHTVGLVHSEADVQDAARLLTGLTVDKGTGRYRYDADRHAVGPVRILGFAHANDTRAGGETAAMALLEYLATHPATARRIATKLCVRFVSDDPPPALVDRLARVYLDSGTAIPPVLKALFGSAEFACAVGAKVRTPLEDVAASLRVLGIGPEPAPGTAGLRALYWLLDGLGHAPLRWAQPDGYPDVATAWASPGSYLGRWNAHLNLAAGWHPKQLSRPASLVRYLVPTLPATYGELVGAVATRLVGRPLSAPHTAAVTAFFGRQPGSPLKATDSAVGGKFPYLVALVLDSPYFAVR